jgi:choline kinase
MEDKLKAVILAAGVGSRLGELTKNKPKCMLPVLNDMLLIDYQIEKLKEFGIKEKDIFIIGGYKIDVLKKHLKDTHVNVLFNPKFREWNNIYTFYLIKEIREINNDDEFVLLNSDTFFHKDILRDLLSYQKHNCVVLDTSKNLGSEEMKVLAKENRIIRFGKDIPINEAKGEYIGLAKFKKSLLNPLFDTMKELIDKGKTNIWYEIAFNCVLDEITIEYVDTKGKPWIEIDTPEDYRVAKNLGIKP